MLLFNRIQVHLKIIQQHFNTSNVTIQQFTLSDESTQLFHFNTSNVTIQLCRIRPNIALCYISIHLMLLFNEICNTASTAYYCISIHLMLLFNEILPSRAIACLTISIHLMLLFNDKDNSNPHCHIHFNTSNVTIQRLCFVHLNSYQHISIHLMLLFNYYASQDGKNK